LVGFPYGKGFAMDSKLFLAVALASDTGNCARFVILAWVLAAERLGFGYETLDFDNGAAVW